MKIKYNAQPKPILLGMGFIIPTVVCIAIAAISTAAQTTIDLPQLVLEAKHTEYVRTQNTGTPNIINVKSSNPSVAKADVYRVDRVQIVAVAPGSTNVEFFDTTQRILYKVLVWVTAPNSTGGGGSGFNPRLTQLAQIIMLVNRTENAHTPNDRAARISGVTSSNPSVATARTDPPRGIQIYSRRLGDTWVNFTNNTTGITYQVHVWVVNKLSDPVGGGGGGNPPPNNQPIGGPKPMPKSNPRSNPIQLPSPGLRNFDTCLIGTWRTASHSSLNSGSFGMNISSEGLLFIVKPNAEATFDYSEIKPAVNRSPYGGDSNPIIITTTFTGQAHARISDNRNHMIHEDIDGFTSNVTSTESYSDGTPTRVVKKDHEFLPYGAQVVDYTCGPQTLVMNFSVPVTFNKVK